MALRILYVGHRNTYSVIDETALTQANPVVVANKSSTFDLQINEKGVLGGSVAFSRPDKGNGVIGGAPAGVVAGALPLGLFINDAVGNPYENTPAVASGKAPYVCGMGTVAVNLYETKNIDSGAGLTYNTGDKLYASKNGLLTKVLADNNLYETAATATLIGVVIQAPTPGVNDEMVLDLRV